MSVSEFLGGLGSELVQVTLGSSCIVCDGALPVRRRVSSCCIECWIALPRLVEARCGRCALPLPASGEGDADCIRCLTEPLATSWIDSWGKYDSGLTKVLQAFKFAGQSFLSEPLSDLLATVVNARAIRGFDVVAPVPMTPGKERQRGYNQAALLAKSLARRIGVPWEERLLRKTAERRTQSELKKAERRANVAGTFAASRSAGGERVLLVDDICTTGETLSACAAALHAAGAADVAAVTVARTP